MSTPFQPLIVLADDDAPTLKVMEYHMKSWGYRASMAASPEELLPVLKQELPSLLLLDLRFADADGLQVLEQVHGLYPNLPIIMLTGHGSIDTAVKAIKRGACDYLTKPPDLKRMRIVLNHLTQNSTPKEPARPESTPAPAARQSRMWGESPAMKEVQALIESVAPTEATVLILGESGTGKELVAREIHERSARSAGPFVAINMAALPRELVESTLFGHEKGSFTGAVQAQVGCCEAAEGGTLFLDEIGEMDLNLQAKLLRFLQERTIQRVGATRPRSLDVRVVTATNRDLLEQVKLGKFREDLYYRLHVVPIVLAPLRQRRGDVTLLATRFLQNFATKYRKDLRGFTPDATELLERYDWPGNVRQLENLIERLVILSSGPMVAADLFPPELRGMVTQPTASPVKAQLPLQTGDAMVPGVPQPALLGGDADLRPIDLIEKRAICEALEKSSGNVRDAARLLGLGQATVYRKIKRFNIEHGSFPSQASVTQSSFSQVNVSDPTDD